MISWKEFADECASFGASFGVVCCHQRPCSSQTPHQPTNIEEAVVADKMARLLLSLPLLFQRRQQRTTKNVHQFTPRSSVHFKCDAIRQEEDGFWGVIIHGSGDTFHVFVYDKNSTLANTHLALYLGVINFLIKPGQ